MGLIDVLGFPSQQTGQSPPLARNMAPMVQWSSTHEYTVLCTSDLVFYCVRPHS